jgi:para-aminobenzoate synthetase
VQRFLTFFVQIRRLVEPRHGLVLEVTHQATELFDGLESFNATMYHSLHVDLGGSDSAKVLWKTAVQTPELQPLAWDLQDKSNGPVLMAAKHTSKPFYGVQFHPESVTTGARASTGGVTFGTEGSQIVQQWWKEVQKWRSQTGHLRKTKFLSRTSKTNSPGLVAVSPSITMADRHLASLQDYIQHARTVQWKSFHGSGLSVQSICQELNITIGQAVVLESALKPNGSPLREDTGRYSIIGILSKENPLHLNFLLNPNPEVHIEAKGRRIVSPVGDFWVYLNHWMQQLKSTGGASDVPFWGGFMGYISYEAGLGTIGVKNGNGNKQASTEIDHHVRPASTFALILRSIVIDHLTQDVYVQSVQMNDQEWINGTTSMLSGMTMPQMVTRPLTPPPKEEYTFSKAKLATLQVPGHAQYIDKVKQCQSSIRNGDSYELCLTDRTTLRVHPEPGLDDYAWPLYRRMIKLNAAPFAAYMRLKSLDQEVTILSSSPERFLSWNRTGRCQYRPIKGTVKKTPGMTLQDAEAILKPSLNAKDVAENLMITDLIRHDIHGVAGAGNVHVTKLFGVEEYQTVFQLVSVIEGQLPLRVAAGEPSEKASSAGSEPCRQIGSSRRKSYSRTNGMATPDTEDEHDLFPSPVPQELSGIDVLAASIPPGSMTGAPKKRSCELLQDIEERKPRGIYSGVLGYLDVGGGGDFAVVIRTAYRWSDERDDKGNDIWTIGAGGAVTAQSTPEGEADEMMTKLKSVLRAFEGADGVGTVS